MIDMGKLTASIKLHEGLRNFLYTDSTGHVTGGYGHNFSATGISDATADFMLAEDIAIAQADCARQIWWRTIAGDDVRSRALCEICFNVGLGGLLGFRKALAALAAGDFSTSADEFENSSWFQEVGGQPGQRGYILVKMIQTGQDVEQL